MWLPLEWNDVFVGHGVMSNSVVFVTVVVHGSRIMERHSEEKNGHSRSYSAD